MGCKKSSNGAEKLGQIIWADTSLETALKQKPPHAVELDMFVPQLADNNGMECGSGTCTLTDESSKDQTANASAEEPEQSKTLGGFMAVPIAAASFGRKETSVEEVKSYCRKVCCKRILVVIDTGSEAYFVQDDTGCSAEEGSAVPSFLEYCQQQNLATEPSAGMSLTLGDSGGPTFTVEIPLKWFVLTPTQVSENVGPINPSQRTQTIILGNFWLQAIAVTWNASRLKIGFSHLDCQGYRCANYQGPSRQTSQSEAEETAEALKRSAAKKPGTGFRWTGSSLSGRDAQLAGGSGGTPITDTAIDIRFMSSVSNRTDAYGDTIVSVETSDPKDITEPCIDALVSLNDGTQAHVCQVFDTGSEVCLVTEKTLRFLDQGSRVASGACLNGQVTVGDEFRRIVGQAASVKSCSTPSQAQCTGRCCQTCCLAEGTTAETKMPCSVSYCTGMISYEPGYGALTFPLENSTQNLQGVPSLLGRATARCLPAASSGVWGCWFWTQTMTDGTKTQAEVASLPYYILSHLNINNNVHNNMTFRVWRTDLKQAPKDGSQATKLGKPPLSAKSRHMLTRKEPIWEARPDAPASAPLAFAAAPVQPPSSSKEASPPAPSAAPAASPARAPTQPPTSPPAQPPTSPPTSLPSHPPYASCAPPTSTFKKGHEERACGTVDVYINTTNTNTNTLRVDGTEAEEERRELTSVGGSSNAVPVPAPLGDSGRHGVPAWMLLAVAIVCLVLLAAAFFYLRAYGTNEATAAYYPPQPRTYYPPQPQTRLLH